jgi:hypothetical protein
MITPSPQQPHRETERSRYNPITFEQLNKPSRSLIHKPVGSLFPESAWGSFGGLRSPVSCCAALPLFAFVSFEAKGMRFLSPLLILVLLGCLLSRMEGAIRQVAAIPLALSAVKLSFAMSTCLTEDRILSHTEPGAGFDPGFLWLPIFFSVCLAFIRNKETAIFKVIFATSCVLLAAGLLPSQAFIAVFYMVDVLLFFGVVIATFVDLLPYLQNQPQGRSAAVR